MAMKMWSHPTAFFMTVPIPSSGHGGPLLPPFSAPSAYGRLLWRFSFEFTLQQWFRWETGFENVVPLPQWSLYCTHQPAVGREAGVPSDPQWGWSDPREECCGFLSLLWEGSSAVDSWLLPHVCQAGVDFASGMDLISMEFLNKEQEPVDIAGQSPFFPELSPSHRASASAGWRGK